MSDLRSLQVEYTELFHSIRTRWRAFETQSMFGRDIPNRDFFRKNIMCWFIEQHGAEIVRLGELYRAIDAVQPFNNKQE